MQILFLYFSLKSMAEGNSCSLSLKKLVELEEFKLNLTPQSVSLLVQ